MPRHEITCQNLNYQDKNKYKTDHVIFLTFCAITKPWLNLMMNTQKNVTLDTEKLGHEYANNVDLESRKNIDLGNTEKNRINVNTSPCSTFCVQYHIFFLQKVTRVHKKYKKIPKGLILICEKKSGYKPA